MPQESLLREIDEAITWIEFEYGFVTDVLRKCKEALIEADTWQPIDTAPVDGRTVEVYVQAAHGLPGFITLASYHSDAGYCVDELRPVAAWREHQTPTFVSNVENL